MADAQRMALLEQIDFELHGFAWLHGRETTRTATIAGTKNAGPSGIKTNGSTIGCYILKQGDQVKVRHVSPDIDRKPCVS